MKMLMCDRNITHQLLLLHHMSQEGDDAWLVFHTFYLYLKYKFSTTPRFWTCFSVFVMRLVSAGCMTNDNIITMFLCSHRIYDQNQNLCFFRKIQS